MTSCTPTRRKAERRIRDDAHNRAQEGAVRWSTLDRSKSFRQGVRVRFGYRSMLHAKTCTIDGVWLTIGTANLDRLSSVGNDEINAEV